MKLIRLKPMSVFFAKLASFAKPRDRPPRGASDALPWFGNLKEREEEVVVSRDRKSVV